MSDKPRSIRVPVPEHFGDGYGDGEERQWVERAQRIGRQDIKALAELDGLLSSEQAFKQACEQLAENITSWNLTTESGDAFPEPYGNPDAFARLADDNWQLFMWLSELVFKPLALLVRPPKA